MEKDHYEFISADPVKIPVSVPETQLVGSIDQNFITGIMAGVIGVVVSALLTIPANWAIHTIAEQPDISARLDILTAVLLIALSVGLNIRAGLRPSRKASRSDPVAALRDE